MIDGLTASVFVGTGAALGAAALVAHTWLIGQVAGQHGQLTSRLAAIDVRLSEPPPQASDPAPTAPEAVAAPDFTLVSTAGATVGLDDLRARGKPVMLLFTDPAGRSGRELLPAIGQWQAAHGAPLTVVVVTGDRADRSAMPALPDGITAILFQPAASVSGVYGVRLAPGAVLVRPSGALAGKPVYGVAGIRGLLDTLAISVAEANAKRDQRVVENTPGFGTLAPAVILPGLDNVDREVADTGGQPTVLLFWSPLCGYCIQVLKDMRAWEAALPVGASRLTILSRGSADEVRAEGFTSRVLLDEDLSASSAFGVTSTPSAIVIDGRGVVVSPMARGIREVRSLLGLDEA